MIEDKFPNFCVHPFVKMFGAANGNLRPCCESTLDIDRDNYLSESWNNKDYQWVRSQFNNRIMPTSCEACIKDEKHNYFSQRMYINKIFAKEAEYYYNNKTTIVPNPIAYDFRYTNECNLQCLICNPSNSNQLSKSMDLYNLKKSEEIFTVKIVDNKKISEIYKKQLIENAKSIKEITVGGGEPFLIKDFLNIVEYLVDNNFSKNIDIKIITNGTVVKESWIKKYLTQFRLCRLMISIDGIEEIIEYCRYPTNWNVLDKKLKNIKNIVDNAKNMQLRLVPTLYLTNLKGLPKLCRYGLENNLKLDFSFLIYPNYWQIDYIRNDIRNEIVKQTLEIANINKLEILNTVHNIKSRKFKKLNEKDRKDFITMIKFLDDTRKHKFLDLYPELDYLF